MEEERNTAYDYARIIRDELRALETLLHHWGEFSGADVELGDFDAETVEEVSWAMDEFGLVFPLDSDGDALADYLNETCLELVVLKATGDSGRVRVEILRTSGGPRCDIFRDTYDSDMVEVVVYSGSDVCHLRVSLPEVSSGLDMVAECY